VRYAAVSLCLIMGMSHPSAVPYWFVLTQKQKAIECSNFTKAFSVVRVKSDAILHQKIGSEGHTIEVTLLRIAVQLQTRITRNLNRN